MTYIDTNVIVSYINERDFLHERARTLLSTLKKRTISKLVILELYSVFSRVSKVDGIELEALVEYSLESTNVELVSVDFEKLINLAMKYSGKLRLKTLDLLHVVAASLIDNSIATFDRDIIRRREEIEKNLKIKVITVEIDGGIKW